MKKVFWFLVFFLLFNILTFAGFLMRSESSSLQNQKFEEMQKFKPIMSNTSTKSLQNEDKLPKPIVSTPPLSSSPSLTPSTSPTSSPSSIPTPTPIPTTSPTSLITSSLKSPKTSVKIGSMDHIVWLVEGWPVPNCTVECWFDRDGR